MAQCADLESFDFEYWSALSSENPDIFEAERLALIESIIAAAPADHQRRLRGLMFEVEARRSQAKNAVDSSVLLSSMMWDRFEQLRLHLQSLAAPDALLSAANHQHTAPQEAAKVLEFKRL